MVFSKYSLIAGFGSVLKSHVFSLLDDIYSLYLYLSIVL
jgi:hypothetical protein